MLQPEELQIRGAPQPQQHAPALAGDPVRLDPAAVAAVQNEGPVVLVPGKALTDLAPGVAELRDRTVFPAFDLGAVKRARVTGGDKPLVVEKTGETEWKQVEPSRGATKDGRVANVLLAYKVSLRSSAPSAKCCPGHTRFWFVALCWCFAWSKHAEAQQDMA